MNVTMTLIWNIYRSSEMESAWEMIAGKVEESFDHHSHYTFDLPCA